MVEAFQKSLISCIESFLSSNPRVIKHSRGRRKFLNWMWNYSVEMFPKRFVQKLGYTQFFVNFSLVKNLLRFCSIFLKQSLRLCSFVEGFKKNP